MIIYCFVQAVWQQPASAAYSLQLKLFWCLKQDMAFEWDPLGEFGKAFIVLERCLCPYNKASAPACVQHCSFTQVNWTGMVTAAPAGCWAGLHWCHFGCPFNRHITLLCGFQECLHHLTVQGLNMNLCTSPDRQLCAHLKMLLAGAQAARASHCFLLLLEGWTQGNECYHSQLK